MSLGVSVRLYLASTSPARLATLRAVGVEPVLLASNVDEDAAVAAAGPLTAAEMVLLLARLKAEAVVGRTVDGQPIDGFILGGDSAFELDGIVYGKPHEPAVARERWLLQRGREGELHSGHWLIDHRGGVPGGATGGVSTSSVRFAADIGDDEIDAYIDSLGAPFISEVRGDPHAVVGLSVALLRELLLEFGVRWHTLWNRAL
jgi:septum formation protein